MAYLPLDSHLVLCVPYKLATVGSSNTKQIVTLIIVDEQSSCQQDSYDWLQSHITSKVHIEINMATEVDQPTVVLVVLLAGNVFRVYMATKHVHYTNQLPISSLYLNKMLHLTVFLINSHHDNISQCGTVTLSSCSANPLVEASAGERSVFDGPGLLKVTSSTAGVMSSQTTADGISRSNEVADSTSPLATAGGGRLK